ncbi:MAG: hypothetical protein ACOXZ9_08365 [Bacteroidales bacterium]
MMIFVEVRSRDLLLCPEVSGMWQNLALKVLFFLPYFFLDKKVTKNQG